MQTRRDTARRRDCGSSDRRPVIYRRERNAAVLTEDTLARMSSATHTHAHKENRITEKELLNVSVCKYPPPDRKRSICNVTRSAAASSSNSFTWFCFFLFTLRMSKSERASHRTKSKTKTKKTSRLVMDQITVHTRRRHACP